MATHQVPPSLGSSRQEYWSGLPFPSPIHACLLSHFSHFQLCVTLWTAAHQAPLSTGFSRPECWSGLPFPSPYIGLQGIKKGTSINFYISTSAIVLPVEYKVNHMKATSTILNFLVITFFKKLEGVDEINFNNLFHLT